MLGKRMLMAAAGSGGLRFVGQYAEAFLGTLSNSVISLTGLSGGLDSAPSEGDIVIVNYTFSGTANQNVAIITSGYTELADLYANDSVDCNFGVYWKIMGATPDTSVTVDDTKSTADAGMVAIHVWRGADQATPIDVTSTTATGTGSSDANPPAITPSTTGAVILACGGAGTPLNSITFTHPALDNLATTTSAADDNDGVAGIVSYSDWVSGSYNPAAFAASTDSASSSWCALTLALRPAT